MTIKGNSENFFNQFSGRFLLIVSFFAFSASAQVSTVSPYSRFGIGDLSSITFARNLSMGGTEIGLNQPGFINFGNPAAYSALWFTTYEGGIDFKQFELKSDNAVQRSHTSTVSYFDFAFPIKAQKWSVGFGLLPYSKVGYNITDNSTSGFGDAILTNYQGSGGLNNFHIVSGIKITKKISFGLTAEYLFGEINNDRTVAYYNPDYFNSDINTSTSIGKIHFNTGLQIAFDSLRLAKSDSIIEYDKRLVILQDSMKFLMGRGSVDSSKVNYADKNILAQEIANVKLLKKNVVNKKAKSDWHLVLGLVLSPAADLNARQSTMVRSFRYFSYANPLLGTLIRDTVVNTESSTGHIRLPLKTGFGFSLYKGSKWMFCSDFTYQKWSDFSYLGAPDSLVDSWKVSAGIQFTPNDRALKSYLKTMQYRVGFHYEHSYLTLHGHNIPELGISAGLGIPVRKAGTMLHFTCEAGKRGMTTDNLILERYIKFTLGFTINDRWFIKTKYD